MNVKVLVAAGLIMVGSLGQAAIVRTRYIKTESFGLGASDATRARTTMARKDGGGFYVISDAKRTIASLTDIVVSSYQGNGGRVWMTSIDSGGGWRDTAIDAVQDSAGAVYVLGQTQVGSINKFMVAKVRADGSRAYTVVFDGSTFGWNNNPRRIAVDATNNVSVVGDVYSPSNPSRACLVRLNTTGGIVFRTTYTSNAAQANTGVAVAVDSSNNIVITGNNFAGNLFYCRKYSPAGTMLFSRTQTGYTVSDCSVDRLNNVVVTGSTGSVSNASPFVQKRNGSLAVLWTRISNFPGNGQDSGYQVAVDDFNFVVAVGEVFNGANGTRDGWITRISDTGVVQWNRLINETGEEAFYSLIIDDFNEVYAGGWTTSEDGVFEYREMMVTKVSRGNSLQWTRRYYSGDDQYDTLSDIAFLEGTGDVLLVGENSGFTNDRLRMFCLQQSAVAIADGFSVASGALLIADASDNDYHFVDGTYVLVTPPTHGDVSLFADGQLEYMSDEGYTGPDSFTYRITKPSLDPSPAITVFLTVTN